MLRRNSTVTAEQNKRKRKQEERGFIRHDGECGCTAPGEGGRAGRIESEAGPSPTSLYRCVWRLEFGGTLRPTFFPTCLHPGARRPAPFLLHHHRSHRIRLTAEGEQLFMVWDNKAERATLQDPQCIEVFWSPEEHTVKDVAQYLSLIPDLDWSQPKALIGLPRILLPEIQSLDSIGGRQVQVHVKRKGHVYNLEAPAILDTELPPEYHISSLNENEASVVWTNWEFNFLDSEDNIRHDIAHFPSSGIRKRSLTDSAGSPQEAAKETLVSWVRTTKNGWMGNTFTLPRHRRKGLASRATLALAHQMLQEGFFAIVVIEDFNAASAKFHESLGFKRLCAIAMAVLVPAETTGQDCLE
ncbi:uncharacterized protein LOC135106011 isoform X2 [Scylla paramamosain]|uniref:uncharacterized protein LOC135106011 isoform X2 n=1 Tax=Scylla paramamosain TaxID=85552 RepID=UPI00308368C7